MKRYIFLVLLEFFRPVFKWFKIDYVTMRRILQVKLTLGDRRVPALHNARGGNDEETDHYILKQAGFLMVVSIFNAFFMVSAYDIFLKMTITLGIGFFMLSMTMTADFTEMLLDVKDKQILGVMPVDARTLNTVRFLNAFHYVSIVAFAINFIPMVVGIHEYGATFGLLFLVVVIMMTGMSVFTAAFIYSALMHFLDGEKLKDAINYAQVGIVVMTSIGYQIVMRVLSIVDRDLTLDIQWWCYLTVPTWFAAPFKGVFEGVWDRDIIALTSIAICTTVLGMILYFFYIAPKFETQLLRLLSMGEQQSRYGYYSKYWRNKWIGWISKDPVEASYFRFSWSLITKDRDFKLKIYPNLTLCVLFPLMMLFNSFSRRDSFEDWLHMLRNSHHYISNYYAVAFFCLSATLVFINNQHKASWIYRVLPNINKQRLKLCTAKVFIIQYLVPMFVLLTAMSVYLYGWRTILDLIIILSIAIAVTLLMILKSKYQYPFSVDYKRYREEHIGTYFMVMFLVGGFSVFHYIISRFGGAWPWKWIYLAVIWGVTLYLVKKELVLPSIKKEKESITICDTKI